MANPSIKELQNSEKFELLAELSHQQIKEFVIHQLSEKSKFTLSYMIYQVLMVLIGIFFFTGSIVLAFQGELQALYFSLAALVFCFSLLIIIHELLHGLALKLMGAKNINFGGYLKKFIFYAEADQFVLNRKQFAFVALTPLVFVQVVSFIGILFFMHSPLFYFFIFVMSVHSLFCTGDIGLLSILYKSGKDEIYTFDIKEEKTSYYYQKKIRL